MKPEEERYDLGLWSFYFLSMLWRHYCNINVFEISVPGEASVSFISHHELQQARVTEGPSRFKEQHDNQVPFASGMCVNICGFVGCLQSRL